MPISIIHLTIHSFSSQKATPHAIEALEANSTPFYHKSKYPFYLYAASIIFFPSHALPVSSIYRIFTPIPQCKDEKERFESISTYRRWACRCLVIHQHFVREHSHTLKSVMGMKKLFFRIFF
jgi:hypothetical protein